MGWDGSLSDVSPRGPRVAGSHVTKGRDAETSSMGSEPLGLAHTIEHPQNIHEGKKM